MQLAPLVRRSLFGSLLSLALVAGGDASARPPEGGYFGFGLGYGIVSGERGVPLEPSTKFVILAPRESPAYEEVVRTDFGAGLSFELRFGWLFGPVAAELALFGHGEFNFENGAGYPGLNVRFHPLMLVDSLAESPIDANVYLGAGYVIGGYQPDEDIDDDGKGWSGWHLQFGAGASYDLSKRVRLGLDVKFVLPMYGTWMFDWDDDINGTPESTPSTLVIAPSLQIEASF